MDGMELQNLGEAARITEKLADFAGNVILQLMQKQGYVEKRGIKAILSHVEKGNGTLTASVSEERAEAFKELLKENHIPYVEIAHTDPETRERVMFFVYRDSDRGRMEKVIREFLLDIDKSCHEVDLDTFERMMDGQTYGSVSGMSREEIYIFREAAKNHDIHFSIVADGSRYRVVANDAGALEDALADMAYYMAGERGRAYQGRIAGCLLQREGFLQKVQPEKGIVKYVVDVRNPQNFISIDEKGFTTHSVRAREEPGPDGAVKRILYDAMHNTCFGMDKEWLQELASGFSCAVVLSEEEFPLVQGITAAGEAVLSPDFVEQYGEFLERMKKAGPDIRRMPGWESLYKREALAGYRGLPVAVAVKIREAHIPNVYINGGDIAFTKEAEPQVEALLWEHFYRDMTEAQCGEARERHYGTDRNEAVDFMLTIEPLKIKGLYKRYRLPLERMDAIQKEALASMESRGVSRQIMNRGTAQRLRDRQIDRKVSQDMERQGV